MFLTQTNKQNRALHSITEHLVQPETKRIIITTFDMKLLSHSHEIQYEPTFKVLPVTVFLLPIMPEYRLHSYNWWYGGQDGTTTDLRSSYKHEAGKWILLEHCSAQPSVVSWKINQSWAFSWHQITFHTNINCNAYLQFDCGLGATAGCDGGGAKPPCPIAWS